MPAARYLEDFGATSEFGLGAIAKGGGFLAAFNGQDPDPQFTATSEDRGGFRGNGRFSLGNADAAFHLTRDSLHWDGAAALGQAVTITYAFRSTGSIPFGLTGFSRFTDAQIAATQLSLSAWSDVANITFQRVSGAAGEANYSDNAAMLFGNFSFLQLSQQIFVLGASPGSRDAGSAAGDVWANIAEGVMASPTLLTYGQRALTYATGLALGLQAPTTTYFENTQQFTLTSLRSEMLSGAAYGIQYTAAPMLDDIAAIQRLYGANMTTRTGDTVYGFNSTAGQPWFAPGSGNAMIFAVWDAGGVDTLDFSGYSVNQTIDLRQTGFSSVGGLTGNVAIAMGAVIENAIGGSGSDTITGNSGDNVLTGNGGQDRIDGGLGSDTAVFRGQRSEYTITVEGQVVLVAHRTEGTSALRNVEFLRFADQTLPTAMVGGLYVSGDILNNVMGGTAFGDYIYGLGGNDTLTGLGGNDILDGGSGNDIISGGDGNDYIVGGLGNDRLDGGAGIDVADYSGGTGGVRVNLVAGIATGAEGNDTLTGIENIVGGAGDDVLIGDGLANRIEGRGGVDVLIGGGGNDVLIASAPSSNPLGATLDGGDGNDILEGGVGIDILIGGAGSDTIDGGFGVDTLMLSGTAQSYVFVRAGEGWRVTDALGHTDTVTSVERVSFAGAAAVDLETAFAAGVIDPFRYMAGYPDLLAAFRTNPAGAIQHYVNTGRAEGRSAVSFDGLQYIASHPDLILALGADSAAGARHYVQAGAREGRAVSAFDPLMYAASNPDLARVFGLDARAVTAHFISAGFGEGRPTTGFNPLLYLASNPALARALGVNERVSDWNELAVRHYLSVGAQSDGPVYNFDPLMYAASNPDLARVFGADGVQALLHYLRNGADEGRATAGFDALLYAASHVDLARVFGTDAAQALLHYLYSGADEGRAVSGFDSVAYLLSNGDLAGLGVSGALQHWLGSGADEGRIGDAGFGRDQTVHQFAGSISGVLEQASDRDWFQTNLTGGQGVTISLTGSATTVELFDAFGNRIASVPGQSGNVFNITATGSYYVVVSGASGDFTLSTSAAPLVSALLEAHKDEGPQVQPGLTAYDPADVVIDFKIHDDVFVLPPQDELEPLVLPDVEANDPMFLPLDVFAMRNDDRMEILPANDDGALLDTIPWHRAAGDDGWMQY